jgi:hypothetical protein
MPESLNLGLRDLTYWRAKGNGATGLDFVAHGFGVIASVSSLMIRGDGKRWMDNRATAFAGQVLMSKGQSSCLGCRGQMNFHVKMHFTKPTHSSLLSLLIKPRTSPR